MINVCMGVGGFHMKKSTERIPRVIHSSHGEEPNRTEWNGAPARLFLDSGGAGGAGGAGK